MLTDRLTKQCRYCSRGLVSFQASCEGMTGPYLSIVCIVTKLFMQGTHRLWRCSKAGRRLLLLLLRRWRRRARHSGLRTALASVVLRFWSRDSHQGQLTALVWFIGCDTSQQASRHVVGASAWRHAEHACVSRCAGCQ